MGSLHYCRFPLVSNPERQTVEESSCLAHTPRLIPLARTKALCTIHIVGIRNSLFKFDKPSQLPILLRVTLNNVKFDVRSGSIRKVSCSSQKSSRPVMSTVYNSLLASLYNPFLGSGGGNARVLGNGFVYTRVLGNGLGKVRVLRQKSTSSTKVGKGQTTMGLIGNFGIGKLPPFWTTLLLAVNALMFAGTLLTKGRLVLLGAKVNVLIDRGQWWRFFTCALLHADIMHLFINSMSLRNVGSSLEILLGGPRFLAIYWISALAGSYASYRFTSNPSIGASGAIMGLVGAQFVFLFRNRDLLAQGGSLAFNSLLRTVVTNLVLGFFMRNVDNWGHVGGLLGGMVAAWCAGPVWRKIGFTVVELSLLQRLGIAGI